MNSKESQRENPIQLTESEREFIGLLGLLPFDTLMIQVESVLTHSPHLRAPIERALEYRLTRGMLRVALARIEDVINLRRWTHTVAEDGDKDEHEPLITAPSPQKAAGAANMASSPTPTDSTDSDILRLKVDAELGRLAIALKETACFRVWLIARHFSLEENSGCGWLTLAQLNYGLSQVGIQYTPRHFRRLMKHGLRKLWHIHEGRIYLRGIANVAADFTARAYALNPALIATNRPGSLKPVYVAAEPSLEGFEAQLYAGWFAAKNAPTIARETLATLFHRTPKTLRLWEQHHLQSALEIRPSFAQIADAQAYRFPEHAFSYVAAIKPRDARGAKTKGTVKHEIRVRWQLPNTYVTQGIRQHSKRGQARRIRIKTNAVLELLTGRHTAAPEQQPPALKAGGSQGCLDHSHDGRQAPPYKAPPHKVQPHKAQRQPRRYFETRKQLRRIQTRILRISIQTNTELPKNPRYLFIGRDNRGHNIYEPTENGFTETDAFERVSPRQEGIILGRVMARIRAFSRQKLAESDTEKRLLKEMRKACVS